MAAQTVSVPVERKTTDSGYSFSRKRPTLEICSVDVYRQGKHSHIELL